jgi:hypothetical protein
VPDGDSRGPKDVPGAAVPVPDTDGDVDLDVAAGVPDQLEALLTASRAQQELIREALSGLLAVLANRGTPP